MGEVKQQLKHEKNIKPSHLKLSDLNLNHIKLSHLTR